MSKALETTPQLGEWDSSLVLVPRNSGIMNGKPSWCNSRSEKMRNTKGQDAKIWLKGSAAELTIEFVNDEGLVRGWLVKYTIRHGAFSRTDGQVLMSTPQLKAAFCGVNHSFGRAHEEAGRNHVAFTAIMLGKFVRFGQFLNIPCAGMGYAGDPNISICVSSDIMTAVKRLINRNDQKSEE